MFFLSLKTDLEWTRRSFHGAVLVLRPGNHSRPTRHASHGVPRNHGTVRRDGTVLFLGMRQVVYSRRSHSQGEGVFVVTHGLFGVWALCRRTDRQSAAQIGTDLVRRNHVGRSVAWIDDRFRPDSTSTHGPSRRRVCPETLALLGTAKRIRARSHGRAETQTHGAPQETPFRGNGCVVHVIGFILM